MMFNKETHVVLDFAGPRRLELTVATATCPVATVTCPVATATCQFERRREPNHSC